jgi:hypothetical protein
MKSQLLPYSCVGHPVGQSCTPALVGGSLELLTEPSTFVIHMVELLHVDRLLYVGYYEPKDDGAGNCERCEAFFTHSSFAG